MQNIIAANTKTMSSREIAELVDSRHDSVKRSMETLRDKGVISFTQSVETSHEGAGARSVAVYLVGKRDSYIIVAQLCPEFTARLVDRWQELEAAQQFLIPQNLPDALRLAADLADQRNAAQAALAIAAPKAEALDLIATADGMLNLQTAGKVLQQQPNKFVQWLRENGWIYKRAGSAVNCARSEKYNAGYLTTKATKLIQPDGSERVREQVMVTPKGLAKLALMLGVQPMLGAV